MSSNLNLLAPVNDSAAEAGAATFSWSPSTLADQYRIQVAGDSNFSNVVFDAVLPGTTVFTLFNTLRPREEAYYWRVQSGRGGQEAWSETASFHAVSDEAMASRPRAAGQAAAPSSAHAAARPAAARPSPVRVAASAHDASAPYLSETTSSGMSTAILVIAVLMMIGIVFFSMMGDVWV